MLRTLSEAKKLDLLYYFYSMRVANHKYPSVIGIVLLIAIVFQIISGVAVCFSLIADAMLIPVVRNEEDMEDMYTDDFFWLHERGVDYIFILIYFHLLRKLFLLTFYKEQESAWKTGVVLLLLLHLVTFFGLVLCCTHLSEITLTIAANILHTFSLKVGKIYWWFFPNQELNTDTIIRLMDGHYVSAFIFLVLAIVHSLEMHRDWKDSAVDEANEQDLIWWDDALKSELKAATVFFGILFLLSGRKYHCSETLSLELFMWGDLGMVPDIRFYGVTPHWYFRAYMSWLIVCPHHYMGIGGMLFFFVALYYQPNVKSIYWQVIRNFAESNLFVVSVTLLFALSIFYASSYLPYGKFYNRLGGNPATLVTYMLLLSLLAINFKWFHAK